MSQPGFTGLGPNDDPRRISEVVNNLLAGKMNATSTVTLTPSATSTALIDSRISPMSVILLSAITASAAAALSAVYIDTLGKGTATIHHASGAAVDQTFGLVIIG